jgi:uncharacterized protein (DUF1330 family)
MLAAAITGEIMMAKAYWFARMTINNPDEYPKYVETAKPAFEKFGARFLARGGRYDAVEGDGRPRNVIIEFDSFEKAIACYNSPEYQAAAVIRQRCSEGEMVVVEGVD